MHRAPRQPLADFRLRCLAKDMLNVDHVAIAERFEVVDDMIARDRHRPTAPIVGIGMPALIVQPHDHNCVTAVWVATGTSRSGCSCGA